MGLRGSPRLSRRARAAIADDEQNDIFVSAASAWEITTKFRIGKLADAGAVAHDVAATGRIGRFRRTANLVRHAQRAGDLGGRHKDPFDRMLVAQALIENYDAGVERTRV